MYVTRQTVSVTTDGSGVATAYSDYFSGRIHSIQYVKNNYDDTVDFTITLDGTGEQLWTESNVTASKIVYPRVGVHDTVGVAATLDGTRAMRDAHVAVVDRVKIVLAQGGAAKAGTFKIIYG